MQRDRFRGEGLKIETSDALSPKSELASTTSILSGTFVPTRCINDHSPQFDAVRRSLNGTAIDK